MWLVKSSQKENTDVISAALHSGYWLFFVTMTLEYFKYVSIFVLCDIILPLKLFFRMGYMKTPKFARYAKLVTNHHLCNHLLMVSEKFTFSAVYLKHLFKQKWEQFAVYTWFPLSSVKGIFPLADDVASYMEKKIFYSVRWKPPP